MKSNFWKSIVLALLLALLCAGCASMRWHKPQISLVDVRLAGGNLFESRLALKVRVHNDNDRDIVLDSLVFDMQAGDFVLAKGLRTDPIVLARMADTIVDIEATAHTLDILRRLPALVQSDGRINYVVRGEAVIRDYGTLPFEHTDSLLMPKLARGAGGAAPVSNLPGDAGNDVGKHPGVSSSSASSANLPPQ